MATTPLLQATERGLYCAAGNFFIDPWGAVEFAVITHAHSDHARPGSTVYLTSAAGAEVLRLRLGDGVKIEAASYGETVYRQGVKISLHPAGHILGSAQVRVEFEGEVWVVSGDYKVEADGVGPPFEPIRCHVFVTESTFGLPIYRWRPQAEIFCEINQWWRKNQSEQRTSVLFGYSLGKAQRLLAGVDPSIGPIFLHGAVAKFVPAYEAAGVRLPKAAHILDDKVRCADGSALVIAPPSADRSPWLARFGEVSAAFVSGWMQLRGKRRWRALDRGFVLSDHADWPGLQATIRATGAEKILVTHGYTEVMVRWLREQGFSADVLPTHFESQSDEESESLPPKTEV
jgi:putative mRNA 3-end processing factor